MTDRASFSARSRSIVMSSATIENACGKYRTPMNAAATETSARAIQNGVRFTGSPLIGLILHRLLTWRSCAPTIARSTRHACTVARDARTPAEDDDCRRGRGDRVHASL